MRSIAIMNQKGGVGKTTTVVNLSAALAATGLRVCLIDLDPQAHATLHFGLDPQPGQLSIYEVLIGNTPLAEVRRQVTDNLWLVPSGLDLVGAEIELTNRPGREAILRERIHQDNLDFDFLLIDCPPSLGLLTLNALAAVHEVFIPLVPHFFALHGLGKLLETIDLVAARLNPQLKLSGIILCMYDANTRLAAEVIQDVDDFFRNARAQTTPWANAQTFQTRIRRNVRLAEAPSFGQSIFQYAPDSHGAEDYRRLAQEILEVRGQESEVRE